MNEFEQQAEALFETNGDLSEGDMLALLTQDDSQGDTGSKPDTGAPDTGKEEPKADEGAAKKEETEPAKDAEPDATKDEPTPVILAKDGVHTIDYSKLVEAREAAKTASAAAAAAQAEAESLRAELAAAKAEPVKDSEARMTALAEAHGMTPEELFGDYSAEQLAKGVEALIEKKVGPLLAQIDQKLAPVQRAAVEDATTKHYTEIFTAHPDAESIVESDEFGKWLDALPPVMQRTYRSILTPQEGVGGKAADVVEVFNAYRSAHPSAAAPAPAPAVPKASTSATAKAQAALAAVKPKSPVTLSDIPAGSAAHVDEAEAMLEASAETLMQRMGNMSPDAIEALMKRAL